MLTVLNVIAPVFAIVIFGFLAVRYKLYPSTGVKGLISFVNNFATPILLFRAMLSVDFQAAFNPFIIGSFYFGAVVAFVVGIVFSRIFFGNRPGPAVASGFGAMFSNCVLLGIPILQRAFGAEAMPIVYSIIGLHAPVLITLGILVMELSRRDGAKISDALQKAGRRAITNPLLIGIAAGLLGNVVGLQLIEPVDAFTRMMAQAVLPVALFGLGGALNDYRIRDNWRQALTMSMIGLFVHPAVAWVVMVPIFHVDPELARFAVVLAAMPAGINVYIFATTYNRSVDVAANVILIGTALSVFSVSLWLLLMTI